MSRPHILVTNDDGIRYGFLHALARELAQWGDVTVVAPAGECSWISKAMTRRRPITAERFDELGLPAWAVSGTPADAVNLALGNLLDSRPDLVVSGINLGYNTTTPLILSSGTVGAAVEGSAWGIPAIAASLQVPKDCFVRFREAEGQLEGGDREVVEAAARQVRRFAEELDLKLPSRLIVHNLNFPWNVTDETPVRSTVPSLHHSGAMFEEESPGQFTFRLRFPEVDYDEGEDRGCIDRGFISHSLLDYSRLGR